MKRVESQVCLTQMNEIKVSLKLLTGSWGIELIKMILPLKCWCEGSFSNFTCGEINLMWFWWIMLTLKKQGFAYVGPPLSSAQFSCSVMSDSLWPHESQHARPPCPSATPGVYSNSGASSRWCHSAISSSVVPFSSCPQSLPASMSQLFTWGGQSIGVSALASLLPMNTQDWSPLGWTGWTSLQSSGLSRVFSNTTVQKHQFFGTQLSLQSNSHIHTWPLEKP